MTETFRREDGLFIKAAQTGQFGIWNAGNLVRETGMARFFVLRGVTLVYKYSFTFGTLNTPAPTVSNER
jgi:hypothetical protein